MPRANATLVNVHVDGDQSGLRLDVYDDGDPTTTPLVNGSGFGITGRPSAQSCMQASPPAAPIDPLTVREEQVLLTMANGSTNAEIAEELHISLITVRTHIASLMTRLGAGDRVEVATR